VRRRKVFIVMNKSGSEGLLRSVIGAEGVKPADVTTR